MNQAAQRIAAVCIYSLVGVLLLALLCLAILTPPAMAYCSPNDVVTTYGAQTVAQLTGDARGVEINDGKLQDAVDDYAEEIRGAVLAYYDTALEDDVPPLLRRTNIEGARILLYERRNGLSADENDPLRVAQKRLDRRLEGIATGKVRLRDEQSEMALPGPSIVTRGRIYGRRA